MTAGDWFEAVGVVLGGFGFAVLLIFGGGLP